jgi:S1-C subfamily serine protease
MKTILSIAVLLFLLTHQLVSQTITSESQAMSYLDQNYYDLEKIEGIYSVDVKFTRPTMYCQPCQYQNYTLRDFDKVGILKSSNKIYQYSYIKGKTTGTFTVENSGNTSMYSSKSNQYTYKIDGINDQFRLSSASYDKLGVYSSNFSISITGVEINKIRDFFGYESNRYLNITCDRDQSLSPYESVCYSYDVTFIYNRIFPTENYTPQAQYGYGTGFVVSNNPLVITTNYHVVQDYQKYSNSTKSELKIIIQGNNITSEFKANILSVDPINDIAYLTISDDNFIGFSAIPYQIKTGANIGQSVFSLGYPLQNVMGQNIKLSTGMITGTTGLGDNENAYTLDLNLNPGNSGGPLFNNNGEVVGIVNARLNDEALGMKVENVSYAIKSEKFNGSLLQKKSPTAPNKLKALQLEEKIKKIKPFIVIIKTRGRY